MNSILSDSDKCYEETQAECIGGWEQCNGIPRRIHGGNDVLNRTQVTKKGLFGEEVEENTPSRGRSNGT